MSSVRTSRLSNSQTETLSQSPGLSLRLQQGQDISFPHGALHVPDDLTVSLTDELHLDLGTLTLGYCSAENFDDSREDDSGLVHLALRRVLRSLVEVNQAILAW